jgi:hypothetical protein
MSDKRPDIKVINFRIPLDVDEWLRHQAERNYSNRNTEVIRTIRDAMDAAGQRREKAAG